MNNAEVVLPVPSLFGSSLMCLSDQLGTVQHDVAHALQSLRDTCPHPRDYPDAELWSRALDQHVRRREALEGVLASLWKEREGIRDLNDAREACFARKN